MDLYYDKTISCFSNRPIYILEQISRNKTQTSFERPILICLA